jgi:S1-C subfamily serine protease
MPNGNRPDDEEIEVLRRSMRPNPKRTVAALAAILTVGIGGTAVAVAHGCNAAEARRHATGTKPTDQQTTGGSPFFSTNRRANAAYAVARQAVAVRTGRNPEPDGVFAQGSGFLMTDGMVITAAHVFTSIAGSERAPLYVLCDDVERRGTVTAIDAIRDVAAISAPGCTGRTLPFSYVEATISDPLHVAGYNFIPSNGSSQWFLFDTSVIPGVVPDPQRNDIEPALANRLSEMKRLGVPPFFALAGELVPGNSGSAVFDDTGRVIGMLVAADSRLNRSYGVSSAVIVDVLRSNGLSLP